MYQPPKRSPWGEIQNCDTLCPGVFMVYAENGGGTMVSKEIISALSPAARKCGFLVGGYLCFGQDSQEYVVQRELLDKKLWSGPDYVKDRASFEESINKFIQEHHPAYWRSRRPGREARQQAEARCSSEHNAGDAR